MKAHCSRARSAPALFVVVINAITLFLSFKKKGHCCFQTPVRCCAVGTGNMRKAIACVTRTGRGQSVTSPRTSASTPPVMTTEAASMESVSASLAIKETAVSKVRFAFHVVVLYLLFLNDRNGDCLVLTLYTGSLALAYCTVENLYSVEIAFNRQLI